MGHGNAVGAVPSRPLMPAPVQRTRKSPAVAIQSEEADLGQWYRSKIVTGDGFVMTIDRVDAFGPAIQNKLIREVRPRGSAYRGEIP